MSIIPSNFLILTVSIAACFVTSACTPRVDGDYRERAWERFTVNGERALSDERYDIATTAFETAVDQARQSGAQPIRIAESVSSLGWAAMKAGQYPKATNALNECLHLCDQVTADDANKMLQIAFVKVRAQTALGECSRFTGKQDDALAHYRSALEIFKKSNFPSDHGYGPIGEVVTVAYSGMGDSLVATSKPAEALDAFRLAAEVSDITPGRLSLKNAAREKYVRMIQTLRPELSSQGAPR